MKEIAHHDDGEEQFGFQFVGVSQLLQIVEPLVGLDARLGVQVAVTSDQTGPLLAGPRARRRSFHFHTATATAHAHIVHHWHLTPQPAGYSPSNSLLLN